MSENTIQTINELTKSLNTTQSPAQIQLIVNKIKNLSAQAGYQSGHLAGYNEGFRHGISIAEY